MKKLKFNELYVGRLVVVSDHDQAQVRTVAGTQGDKMVLLASFEGDNLCTWWTDYSLCLKPTIEQIEYTINNWGRLPTISDVEELELA